MKKLLKTISLAIVAVISINSMEAKAISIVPEVQEKFRSNYSCTIIMKEFEQLYDFGYESGNEIQASDNQKFTCATKDLNNYLSDENWTKKICDPTQEAEPNNIDFKENDILGCSIITGRIRFAYIPRFIVYSLELLTILSGVLSLLFVILGGYYYLINSLAGSDTEKGKSYIKNAIIGLIISLSAWSVINLVQLFFTS